jgi:hypothetical protein
VTLGIAKSRMKDFFDLWHIARKTSFDGRKLSAAIEGTFERRRTTVPKEVPVGLSAEFSGHPMKKTQWRAFCLKAVKADKSADLDQVVDFLAGFLIAVLKAVGNGADFKVKCQRVGLGNDCARSPDSSGLVECLKPTLIESRVLSFFA